MSLEDFQDMQSTLKEEFEKTDLGRVVGSMQSLFKSEKFSIRHLFRDEKRKILKEITDKSLRQVEHGFRDIFDDNYQLMLGMLKSDIPIPDAYKSAIQHIVNTDLNRFFEQDILKINELKRLAKETKLWNLEISNPQALKLSAGERIFYEIQKINYLDISKAQIQLLVDIIELFNDLELELDIWKSQNYYFHLLQDFLTRVRTFPNEEWKAAFLELGILLQVRVDDLQTVKAMNLIEN